MDGQEQAKQTMDQIPQTATNAKRITGLVKKGSILMLSIIGEHFGSRMYNRLDRKRELDEHSANFAVYIENIQKMFFKMLPV